MNGCKRRLYHLLIGISHRGHNVNLHFGVLIPVKTVQPITLVNTNAYQNDKNTCYDQLKA